MGQGLRAELLTLPAIYSAHHYLGYSACLGSGQRAVPVINGLAREAPKLNALASFQPCL